MSELPMRATTLLGLAALAALAAPQAVSGVEKQASSCISCHQNADYFDAEAAQLPEHFAADVHAAVGLSCQDCHGGNPDPALADDPERAMDAGFKRNPYRGAPKMEEIPSFCGRCHSDPRLMRRFKPDQRVDQEQEYWTSHHGLALKQGDDKVATCVSCHGVHGILEVGNPESPVYPTKVAETCNRCHGDAPRMAGRHLADGRPLPVNQFARWRESVHAAALFEKDDLSAPTCNDCHGNHGATPPGVDSVGFVCGQCHGREALLFRQSGKHGGWEEHNEYLAGANGEGCAGCHDPSEPQAAKTGLTAFSECASCHDNHAIVRPTVAILAPLPDTPCTFCHEGTGPLATAVPEPEKKRRHYEEMKSALLSIAEAQGLAGEARFNWLVDQALTLPTHTRAGESETFGTPVLRPEFQELFWKFRIGKTSFRFRDPSGGDVEETIVRCSSCHGAKPVLGEPTGARTGAAYVHGTHELTSAVARAERILLSARRGGVETRAALAELEQAVNSQIELEVLVHGFKVGEGSAFDDKRKEGLEHARQALTLGQLALDELTFRRQGLAVALIVILAVLVGLGLKIRQLGG